MKVEHNVDALFHAKVLQQELDLVLLLLGRELKDVREEEGELVGGNWEESSNNLQ